MEEKMLTLEQEAKIKEKALKIKEEKKLRKVPDGRIWGDRMWGKGILRRFYGGAHFPAVLQVHGGLKEG